MSLFLVIHLELWSQIIIIILDTNKMSQILSYLSKEIACMSQDV